MRAIASVVRELESFANTTSMRADIEEMIDDQFIKTAVRELGPYMVWP